MESTDNAAAGPLKGIKVTDCTSVIAGCVAASLLGDFGAEVIKVEALMGDLARWFGPFLNGEGGMFHGWNRNKRGLAIDIQSDAGREVVYELIRESDIFIENFRPGIVDKLKIDYETVQGINPGIIYCSITGFGPKGPYSKQPAFDPLLQSMTGASVMNAMIAQCGRPACISSVPQSDYAAAFLGAGGIMAALYHREKTGEGQKLETSLLQGAMTMMSHFFFKPLEIEADAPPGIYPYNYYDTKDGVIFVAAANDKFWRLTCEAIGASEIGEDPKYASNPDRTGNRVELHEKVQPYFLEKTTSEWEAILIEKGVPCAPALMLEEFAQHPQVTAMEMSPVLQNSKMGPVRMAGMPVNFSKTPGVIQRTAPALGEHTEAILQEIGYDDARIQQLRKDGVIH